MKANYTKIYSNLGKAACAIAGGIVGFVIAGSLAILPGILVGGAAGFLLEKMALPTSKRPS